MMPDLFSNAGVPIPASQPLLHRGVYPDQPGAKAPGTSQEAADSMKPDASRLRSLVLESLRSRHLTPDECAARLGLSVLSIRPRFTELVAKGAIVATGERRDNASGRRAKVWKIA